MTLTDQGIAIVDAMIAGSNLAVNGIAGCGKSSVVVTGAYRLSEMGKRVLMVTFTNSVKQELMYRTRNIDNVDVKTFHALAMGKSGIGYKQFTKPWVFAKATKDIVLNEIASLVKLGTSHNIEGLQDEGAYILRTIKVPEYIRGIDTDTLNRLVTAIGSSQNISKLTLKLLKPVLLKHCEHIHDQIMALNMNSFDTVLAGSVDLNIMNGYDTVIVSEIQDINSVMMDHLLAFKGQLIVEGDENQSIYGFNGALGKVFSQLKLPMYPLTKSWRNPQSIVRASQAFLRDYGTEPLDSDDWVGSDGSIEEDMDKPMYILSRTNKSLIREAIKYMKEGSSFNVDEITDSISKARKSIGSNQQVAAGRNASEELNALMKLGLTATAKLQNMVAQVAAEESESTYNFDKQDLEDLITMNCSVEDAAYVFMTIHKSKGLTLPNVSVIGSISLETIQIIGKTEYINLIYTAMTRSSGFCNLNDSVKNSLNLLDKPIL